MLYIYALNKKICAAGEDHTHAAASNGLHVAIFELSRIFRLMEFLSPEKRELLYYALVFNFARQRWSNATLLFFRACFSSELHNQFG